MTDLTNPIFHDADKAREFLEKKRWPNGPVCPHCKAENQATQLQGKSTRPGVYKCKNCRKPFSVTVNTVFERSKIPLNKWLLATYLICASKKGMSAHQLHRTLKLTYKTAWFMSHRIREAMRQGGLMSPMGGGGGVVEADETYIGDNKLYKNFKHKKTAHHGKNVVLTLIDRDGEARSFHVARTDARSIIPIVEANLDKEAMLVTDTGGHYVMHKKRFGRDKHEMVNHAAGEYGRGPIHTNTVEGYFSIFKRGMRGVYQHCSEKHLHRYLAEFDFRYSNRSSQGVEDAERAARLLQRIGGKRLMYQRSIEA